MGKNKINEVMEEMLTVINERGVWEKLMDAQEY